MTLTHCRRSFVFVALAFVRIHCFDESAADCPSFAEVKLKKLICHSFMMNRAKHGWVEIDVRQVVRQWEKTYQTSVRHHKELLDPMIAIDVEDEFQNPLKAGAFFEPINCQACKCVVYHFQLTA